MLRALKKKKHCKTKISISKSILRSNKSCYWKASRAIRKNNFNCTNVVDGVDGGPKIANLFKDKYERLFNSVKCSEDENNLLATNIDLEAESCSSAEICERNECTHCHVISSSDVMSAIGKLKTYKISDNGLVSLNNFTHGTELLFQYLGILYTSMIYHGFCPASFFVLTLFPSQKVQR